MAANPLLQQAYQLIRQEQRTEAMQILVPLVRDDPNNADAWWLLANAVTNPDQQRRALEQVLRLRPGDDKAARMLARVTGTAVPVAPSAPPVSPAPVAPAYTETTVTTTRTVQQDPFADPFAAPPAAAPARSRGNDPFDDPFTDPPTNPYAPPRSAGYGSAAPVPSRRGARAVSEYDVAPRRQRGGCATCLIIFAVITLVICGACVVATVALPSAIRPIFNQVADAVGTQNPSVGVQIRNAVDSIYSGDIDGVATAANNLANEAGTSVNDFVTRVSGTIAADPRLRDAQATLAAGGQVPADIQQTLAAVGFSAGINFGNATQNYEVEPSATPSNN